MKVMGSVSLLLSVFLGSTFAFITLAVGAGYPDRPITLVIPYASGGTTDVVARALGDAMERHLKQPVIVSAKPGGGTTVGGNAVASAKPDGYTIGLLTPATYASELLAVDFKVPYVSKDLKPIVGVMEVPMGILAKGDGPYKTLKDYVEDARKNPEGLKMAVLGKNHSTNYILMDIARKEKVNLSGVPFAGGAAMVPAVLGGHVPTAMTGLDPSIKSLLDTNKMRLLAIALNRRVDLCPDVPCLGELGYKVNFIFTCGLYGPKGLPAEIAKKIEDAATKACSDPEFKTRVFNSMALVSYMDGPTYEKTMLEYTENLEKFMRAEGFLK
jgi:tripartite-type tricarboxylate transporter receptor subunit TctC